MAKYRARDTDVARLRDITLARASSLSSLSLLSLSGPATVREIKVDGKVKVDGHSELTELINSLVGCHKFIELNGLVRINEITELLMNNIGCPLVDHMVNGVELYSNDDQVLTK